MKSNKILLMSLFVLGFLTAGCVLAESFEGFKVEENTVFLPASDFALWDKDAREFSFCVISDPHAGEPVRAGYEKFGPARDKFKLALDHIAQSREKSADFVLVCGDIHLHKVKDIVDDCELKLHFIAGNHEGVKDRELLRKSYPEDFNINGKESDYYSFVNKGCRFIGMCNAVATDHVGHLSSETIIPFGQSDWLISELEKEEKIKVVFGHIPPHPDCKDRNMYMSRNDSAFFNNLVKETRPSFMFFGHQHQPTRDFMIGSTKCFVMRSMSWNGGNAPIGYMKISISGKGAEFKEYTFKEISE
ncbi:Calcineurin-like phosphoesterase superfamily domain protein [Limihaloglobus sulfuriphilus]|uniref:Calcineurin-like phosphoesterase superfamily domain protein n=1 Tax=Limihaloglobus sulfuriphilus TaxID=1851148 RepID=A0A1Q2MG26_9BACT|nr:metallophosphoesterase [Limihaloglobus sulfuriphilus]AQQ71630.1 Calcineurin-like phosphoesterase superfamily domain protein [Limihaloglobus sulfuriphilus]